MRRDAESVEFEKRVDEIHEGAEFASIDAVRETGKLSITGFVEKNKEAGLAVQCCGRAW